VLGGLYNLLHMSLITRCPACTTIFKVVPDQLRVSEGWVRCGQCDEVFDANAHLQTTLPLEVVEQNTSAPQTPQPIIEQPVETSADYDWGALASTGMESATDAVAQADADVDALLPEPIEPAPVNKYEPEAEQTPGQALGKALYVPESSIEDVLAISPGLENAVGSAPSPAESAPVEELVRPTFMRDPAATLPKNWGSRRSQWLWRGCVCFLGALLSFQWGVHERDRLSANAPGLRPFLESVCAAAGCKISPMQSIEAVVIDSSAFSKLQADVYQLSFSLKSMAMVEIATPSLELTLTDMQDQPLVRRVFSPSELGRSNQSLIAGGEWAGAKTLVLTPSPAIARIAGYRLLAFYP
jgi:predicted Zn finger-like uncharacterized protein